MALAFMQNPECRRDWRAFYKVAFAVSPLRLDNGQWLIAGRDDVISVMKDEGAELTPLYPATGSPEINELFLGMLPFEQGAEHRRLRLLVSPHFSLAALFLLQRQLAALLDELIYPAIFQPDGCDVLSALGLRLPPALSCYLLDVAPSDWVSVGSWAGQLYRQLGRYDQREDELRDAAAAYRSLCEYVEQRKKGERSITCGGVGDSLLSAWRNGSLNDHQLLSYFALFLLTGWDTITYAVVNSLWFLGNAPDIFAALHRAPEAADAAFDEAIRLWGPIRLVVRHLQRAVPVSSGAVPEGSLVFLLIHAANRDPSRVARPDEPDLNRKQGDDLSFGVGAHGCLGTALGKMVGRALFRSLAERCRSLHAHPGPEDPRFIPSLPILGVESVRLFAEAAERNEVEPARSAHAKT